MVTNEFATGFDDAPNFFADHHGSETEAPSSIPKLAPPRSSNHRANTVQDRRSMHRGGGLSSTEHAPRRMSMSEYVNNNAFPQARRSNFIMTRTSSQRDLGLGGGGGSSSSSSGRSTMTKQRRSSLTMMRTSSQRDLVTDNKKEEAHGAAVPTTLQNRRAALSTMKSMSVRDVGTRRPTGLGGSSMHSGRAGVTPVRFTSSRDLLAQKTGEEGPTESDRNLFADEEDHDDSTSGASFQDDDGDDDGDDDAKKTTKSSRSLFVDNAQQRAMRPTLSRGPPSRKVETSNDDDDHVEEDVEHQPSAMELELMNTFKSFRNVMSVPVNCGETTEKRSRNKKSGSNRSLEGKSQQRGGDRIQSSLDGTPDGSCNDESLERRSHHRLGRRSSMGGVPDQRRRSEESLEGRSHHHHHHHPGHHPGMEHPQNNPQSVMNAHRGRTGGKMTPVRSKSPRNLTCHRNSFHGCGI